MHIDVMQTGPGWRADQGAGELYYIRFSLIASACPDSSTASRAATHSNCLFELTGPSLSLLDTNVEL
jgi:hypothetical protein